jgi:uncharacterized membrane protein YidH (DUF202 family)
MTHVTQGDGGLQRERTRLAWQRTALGVVLGCAVLMLAAIRAREEGVVWASGTVGVLTALAAAFAASRGWVHGTPTPWRLLAPTAGAVMVLAILGAVSAVVRTLT